MKKLFELVLQFLVQPTYTAVCQQSFVVRSYLPTLRASSVLLVCSLSQRPISALYRVHFYTTCPSFYIIYIHFLSTCLVFYPLLLLSSIIISPLFPRAWYHTGAFEVI